MAIATAIEQCACIWCETWKNVSIQYNYTCKCGLRDAPEYVKALWEARYSAYYDRVERHIDEHIDSPPGLVVPASESEVLMGYMLQCNAHRLVELLSTHHTDKVSPHCENVCRYDGDKDCTGWSVCNKRCDCTNFKGNTWELDWDDMCPCRFSLQSTQVVGSVVPLW